jgi:phosphate transport system substrate-binding protein
VVDRLVFVVVAATLASSAAAADTILIQGSTSVARRLLEPHKPAIEAKSGHELTIIPNKSTPGLIALLEGRAHLAMISSSLELEKALLQKSLPGMHFDKLKAFEVSRTRVAIIVHRANPVRSLSLDQIKQVLLGKLDNWTSLGGPSLPIRAVLVGAGGGVTTAVEGQLLDGAQTPARNKIYVRTPVQLIQVVEQEPGALGFAQVALAQGRDVVELATDRPIEQILYLVTMGEPTSAMLSVINATRAVAAAKM